MVTGCLHALLAALVSPWGALAKSAAVRFLIPLQAPPRRSPGLGWGWLSRSWPPANSLTVRTLSKMVKKLQYLLLRMSRMSILAPSSSPSKVVWSPTWPSSLRVAGPRERGMNCFSQHAMGLSKFPDSLPSIILHSSSNIGNGSLCIEVPLIWCRLCWFPLIHLLIIAYIFILLKALSL